ncbi:hypothetical protein M2137_001177, partial [Parabacteroides sp. PFB2-10]|nr:hypothetical protein [Parabacteroides sp. PFB2-10]
SFISHPLQASKQEIKEKKEANDLTFAGAKIGVNFFLNKIYLKVFLEKVATKQVRS